MKKNLAETLKNKLNDDSLASLYLLNYDPKKIDQHKWVTSFINSITPINDHPDILKIEVDQDERLYKVDSPNISKFLSFLCYSPLKLPKKFVFLSDAHLLTTTVSNKLLKILEELNDKTCIFLMVPQNAQVLPTIASRAVKLLIDLSETSVIAEEKLSANLTPQELIKLFKQNPNKAHLLEKELVEAVINIKLSEISCNPTSYIQIDELLKDLKSIKDASAFHNSKLSEISKLFP